MRDLLDFLRPPPTNGPPADPILVFLDSRDLINCLDKASPIGARELGSIFRLVGARLVVTSTTICELFPGATVPQPAEVERGIALARSLDFVPHGFIRTATIGAREFRVAYRAWHSDTLTDVPRVDPFVNRFYKTTWKPILGTTDLWIEDESTHLLDRMPIWDQVRMLAVHPESLRWEAKYSARATAALVEDRAKYGSKRGTKAAREEAVRRQLIAGGLSEPRGGLSPFVKWLHQNPEICPGWRIGWDVWEEYRSNVTAEFDPGDLRDFSHLATLPYVTHFTTDAKWKDLLARARVRRQKEQLRAPSLDRVFKDLSAVLESFA